MGGRFTFIKSLEGENNNGVGPVDSGHQFPRSRGSSGGNFTSAVAVVRTFISGSASASGGFFFLTFQLLVELVLALLLR